MKGFLVKSAIVAGLLAVVPQLAAAQQWPTRPIKAVVPFPAGGGTDLIGRLAAKHIADRLGQQVYVENIGGANGSIGTQAVMRAEPDGYTIGVISDGPMIVNPALYPNNVSVPLRDFAPVAMMNRFPSMLTAHPSTGIKTVPDLIRVAKEKPGNRVLFSCRTLDYSAPLSFALYISPSREAAGGGRRPGGGRGLGQRGGRRSGGSGAWPRRPLRPPAPGWWCPPRPCLPA